MRRTPSRASDILELTHTQRIARAERVLLANDLLALLAPECAGPRRSSTAPVVLLAMAGRHGVRRVSGAIVLITKEGAVTVDHRSFPGASTGWSAKAQKYAPPMGAYAHVLTAAEVNAIGHYVHFTIGAGVVELG